ncbi:hypothetical protein CXB51_002183 [Gossypium anomalum]|uniref:Uncharacterized protein n=1 Tax=Gossypium anomalum TaxID=47600 RepID=A0A8J5ZK23_9ROSI|nr:hypothetical protein CXB51_002183 [Gossypium anomalum]
MCQNAGTKSGNNPDPRNTTFGFGLKYKYTQNYRRPDTRILSVCGSGHRAVALNAVVLRPLIWPKTVTSGGPFMVTERNPNRVCIHFQKARREKKRVPSTLRCLTVIRRPVLLPLPSTHLRVNQGFIEPKDSRVLLTNTESPLGFDCGETSEDSKASNVGAVLVYGAWLLEGTEAKAAAVLYARSERNLF